MNIKNVAFSVSSLKTNQYISLLSNSLQQEGLNIGEIRFADILFDRIQIIHVHWPEHFLRKLTKLKHIRLVLSFLLKLKLAKRKKIPIVWTVHNVWPHENKVGNKLLGLYFNVWSEMVDGCIYMSATSQKECEQAHPLVKGKPSVIIPHGHYKDVLNDNVSSKSSRERLGLNEDDIVLCHCGMIRHYKNTLPLMRAFTYLKGTNLKLIVGGSCSDKNLLREIRGIAHKDSRIRLYDRLLTDDEMCDITAASDLVLLPYKRVTNSGVAIYALSVARPVLGPAQGAFLDLKAQYGEWIQLYKGEFEEADLATAVNWIESKPELPLLDLSPLDWDRLAKQTIEFYERIFVEARAD